MCQSTLLHGPWSRTQSNFLDVKGRMHIFANKARIEKITKFVVDVDLVCPLASLLTNSLTLLCTLWRIRGKNATHQWETISSLPSATIRPQAGVGFGIPAPKKLKVGSTTMTKPTCSVAKTTRLLNILGKCEAHYPGTGLLQQRQPLKCNLVRVPGPKGRPLAILA
ncbi:MAG: hypothetical protein Ct9H300mP11_16380 [Chloroflexota bacterium]|nr:MAG: hypothetical protein Ct9H300mP11_16380 [Chloroflexota bacterium]